MQSPFGYPQPIGAGKNPDTAQRTDRWPSGKRLPASVAAYLACTLEVLAPKAGNVHVHQSFDDATVLDYIASAAVLAPLLDETARRGVGATVLEAVRRTQLVARTNTNLGIVLLLAPLAAVPAECSLADGVAAVLDSLTVEDSRTVYAAIRLASPAGLGKVPDQDIGEEPTLPLRTIMQLAADRDAIARQYACAFRDVFAFGVPCLLQALEQGRCLADSLVWCQLHWLAEFGDSLIARKCGYAISQEAAERARQVLTLGWPDTLAGREAFSELDRWLRGDGHHRNPGTTADLVVATLFVALRDGLIPVPFTVRWA
jgi:triphosphoribosyl-dephospho-CoA synthase